MGTHGDMNTKEIEEARKGFDEDLAPDIEEYRGRIFGNRFGVY